MIVALAQTVFESGQRARNLAALTASIIAAARHTPAPDLILLPDSADLAIGMSRGRLLTRAMCQGLTETLAWLAREWGIWIVAGHAMPTADGIDSAITLFDPDGDPYLRHLLSTGTVPYTARATPLGTVALGAGIFETEAGEDPAEEAGRFDLIVLAPRASATVESKAAHVRFAQESEAYVCVVSHSFAGDEPAPAAAPGSILVGRDGKILAQIPPDRTKVVFGELAIEPPDARVVNRWKEAIEGE